MKQIIIFSLLILTTLCCSKSNADQLQIRSLLVQQLKNAHTNQDWFVPTKKAIAGITLEQSNWKDSTDNHSIGELVSHLIFWNERVLKAFNGVDLPDFKEDNKETFSKYKHNDWSNAISKLDSIQT